MNHKCFRCNGDLKDTTPNDIADIKFLSCKNCPCQYTENSKGRVHDRWLMPITLPLYGVIFEEDPLSCVDNAVNEMASRKREFIDVLIEHISEELVNPKQKIIDLHDFKHPNEERLRAFLKLVKEGVENKRSENV